jgi:S-DNA-T family DNA segregation ATPase FtsK/SpoIIIE
MGFWASSVVLLALAVIGLLLLFEVSLSSLPGKSEQVKSFWQNYNQSKSARKVRKIQEKREKEATREIEVSKVIESASEEPEFFRYQVDVEQAGVGKKIGKELSEEEKEAKQLDLGVGKFKRAKIDLPLSLLDGKTTIPDGGDIKANKLIIQKTLDNFGIASEMGDAQVGPTVTQYTLKPAEGIKLSRITALGDNLALALAAHPIRIEAPIPGRSLVGIEVPNEATAIVPLVDILISEQFKNRKSNLAIALGKDVMGRPWLAELDKMPHLLIAGATGSGKSVCINAVIISLLYQNGPGDLKFIMVDPKRVELPIYNGIPHLLTPVITDVKKTVNALRWAIVEMERRFDTLSQAHQRNIASFNAASPEKMPYIVVIIDELADLMAAAGPEVEAAIVRLSQMSRAVGIHLVLATQRPSVDVLTGLIKANITSRIAFSVASLVDSRTILDMSGAEKLLGRGDMLYISAEISKPKRLQGAYASDEEIKKVINYLKDKAEPEYIEEIVQKQQTSFSGEASYGDVDSDGDSDPLLPEAKDVIMRAKKASASLLQRRLRIGYARAARILDLLEEQGIIGPGDGAKPREVLISTLNNDTINSSDDSYDEEIEEPQDAQDIIEEEESEN